DPASAAVSKPVATAQAAQPDPVPAAAAPSVPAPAPAAAETVAYTVRKGDTLSSISRKFDVPMKEILAQNDLRDPNVSRPGSGLRVPGKKAPVIPPSSS